MPVRASKGASVRVHIFGVDYLVRGSSGPEHTRRLASYVDRMMKDVAKQGSIVSTTKVAVLAALRIADELHRPGRGRPSAGADRDRIRRLVHLTEAALKDRSGEG